VLLCVIYLTEDIKCLQSNHNVWQTWQKFWYGSTRLIVLKNRYKRDHKWLLCCFNKQFTRIGDKTVKFLLWLVKFGDAPLYKWTTIAKQPCTVTMPSPGLSVLTTLVKIRLSGKCHLFLVRSRYTGTLQEILLVRH